MIGTKKIAKLLEKCYNDKSVLTEDQAICTLDILGASIGAYLSREEKVVIKNLGTFYLNDKGWVKFKVSKNLSKEIKRNRGKT